MGALNDEKAGDPNDFPSFFWFFKDICWNFGMYGYLQLFVQPCANCFKASGHEGACCNQFKLFLPMTSSFLWHFVNSAKSLLGSLRALDVDHLRLRLG